MSAITATKPEQTRYLGVAPILARARTIVESRHQSGVLVLTDSPQAAQEMFEALRFFLPSGRLHELQLFTDYETLPYDLFSPSAELIAERLKALYRMTQQGALTTVASVGSALHCLPPPSYLQTHALILTTGDRRQPDQLRRQLQDAGYQLVERVSDYGEFAVRGAIIDLYPSGTPSPCRIEFFDDEVESLRYFDPDTQLSIARVDSIELLPAREFPLDDNSIGAFRNRWLQRFDSDPRLSSVYQAVSKGRSAQGIENYLPLFFERTLSLFDYLPADTHLYLSGNLTGAVENQWHQISQRFEQYGGNLGHPLLEPGELYLSASDLFGRLKGFERSQWREDQQQQEALPLPDVALHYRAEDPCAGLRELMAQQRILICAESAGRREVLLDTLVRADIHCEPVENWQAFLVSDIPLGITLGNFRQGCLFPGLNLALIAENDLLAERVADSSARRDQRRRAQTHAEQIIRNLTELRIGEPVVHLEHGVGRFLGLETLQVDTYRQEFLVLGYAEGNKLYVPVHSLNLISRYSGADADHAPLNRLGSDQWEKAKRRAREKIRDTAAELLEIYARRQARSGLSHQPNEDAYRAFCAEFPFEETEDQLSAIATVESDMKAERPMDRLVCGDVGFGKTEIALRAAFIAVSSGRQVAMLVPTTLLARQHLDTFRDRFANWPVRIDSVSRLRTAADQKAVIQAFSDGQLDILIGTHKLIQERLRTDRLGLVIVDEEHRFGVHQKEKLKALKAEVDILTLTATPIPRTLNMAMAAIRDLSIIATPPARRLAIKTFVRQDDSRISEEAIRRELMRGGQVYLLHNEIRSIERRAEDIRKLVPDARVQVAHGQMREQQLEQVIGDFYHQRFDVLVCTTIIETGIDIPTANTIIIDRADKFGLAQLHQLRGRVGRSHHQAYAYLLTPERAAMTPDALKRLEAIEQADHLGCGFTLATHDLEIRGAGELLGDQQSGQIHAIGFELFQQMLEKAVRQLQKAGREAGTNDASTELEEVEIQLGLPALITDDYLPDINTRLQLYKRIASAADEDELEKLQIEMIDRFGLLPEPAKNLFGIARLKQLARTLGVRKIDCGDRQGSLHFVEKPRLDPMQLIELVQSLPQQYRFQGASRLQFTHDFSDPAKRIPYVRALLDKLLGSDR